METLEQLPYLHDAVVEAVTVRFGDGGRRELELRMRADPDCGLAAWEGRHVVLHLGDVLVFHGNVLGHVLGKETVDSIRPGLPPGAEGTLGELVAGGIRPPAHALTVTLHSGSEIGLAFEAIRVDVEPAA